MWKKGVILTLPLFLFLSVIFLSKALLPSEDQVRRLLSSQVTLIEFPRIELIIKKLSSPSEIAPIRCEAVVPITYSKVVSLEGLAPWERKRRFIDMLLPSVLVVNYEVSLARENLMKILRKLRKGLKLSRREALYVENLLDRCRSDSIEEALIRANPVPPSLAIAQAAIESGWGTSRFFVEGNNPFGIWTFKENSQAIEAREGRARLRKFSSLLEAVREYVYNVNVGWAYRDFRRKRLSSFDPIELSESLSFYSIERERYVEKIQRVIRENNLRRLDLCVLDPAYLR